MRTFFLLVLLVVAFAAVVAAQNVQLVSLAFFGWRSPPLPLAWIVIAALIAGAGVASLFWLTATLRVSLQAGKLKAANRKMEKELGSRATTDPGRSEKV